MKRLFVLLLLVSAMPISFALTFDDFSDSYDYSVGNGDFNVTSISLRSCSQPCDNLTVTLNLSVEPGTYEMDASLDGKTISATRYFFDKQDSIDLAFYPSFSSDSPRFILKAYKDSEEVYFKSQYLNLSDVTFDMPDVTVIDDFEDGGKIAFNISITGAERKEYNLTAYLKLPDGKTLLTAQAVHISNRTEASLYFDPAID